MSPITVEELQILITAETADVKKQVDKVKKNLKGVSESAGTMQKKISASFSKSAKAIKGFSVAIIATGTALGFMAKKSADALNRIDKMSQQMGFSAVQFQQWDYIINRTGGDINGLSEGMESLLRLMSASSSGGETVLDTLGVSAKNTNGTLKTQGTIFEEIIGKLQSVTDTTRRSALAYEVFGGSAKELIPALNGGATAISDLKKEAKELGVVMSGEAVKAGADFTGALEDIKSALAPIGSALVQAFLPLVQAVIPWMVSFTKATRTAIAYVVALFRVLTGLGGNANKAVSEVSTLKSEMADIRNSSNEIGAGTASNLSNATSEAKKLKGQLLGFDEINTLASTDAGATNTPLDVGGAVGSIPNIDIGGMTEGFGSFSDEIDKATENIREFLKVQGLVDTGSTTLFGYEIPDSWLKFIATILAGGLIANLGNIIGLFTAWGSAILSLAPLTWLVGVLDGLATAIATATLAGAPFSGLLEALSGSIYIFLSALGVSELTATTGAILIAGGIIVAIVVAIIAGFVQAYNTIETFKNEVQLALTNTGKLFVALYNSFIKPIFTAIINIFKDVYERGIKPLIEEGIKPLWNTFVKALGYIGTAFLKFYNLILPILTVIIEWLGPIFTEVINRLGLVISGTIVFILTLFKGMLAGIKTAIDGVVIILVGITDFLLGIFTGNFDRAISGLMTVLVGFGVLIGGFFEGLKTSFLAIITWIGDVFFGGWESAWNGVSEVFGTIFDGVANTFTGIINVMIKGINSFINGVNKIKVDVPDWVADLTGIKGGTFGFNIANIPELAGGGMVSTGQLFIANEAGAELVGGFGGQTGVMNNNQIVESVSQGVYKAVASALGGSNSGNNDKEINLVVDGVKLGRVLLPNMNNEATRLGYQTILQER